jgi:aryl-alcohol dehydrogenase-like predicted oxidoreductase
VVGKAIQGRRDQVTIATKCGLVWEEGGKGESFNRLKAWSVRKEAENSLRRLGVDVIDLYQIHWSAPDEDIEEGWTEIAKLIEEGKVRYGGLSNFDVSQIKRCQAIHPIASLQPPYSMLERGIETDLIDYCAQNAIGIVAYSPMVSGLLTGKFTHERLASLPNDDWRRDKGDHFQEPEFSINLDLVESLSAIAKRYNRSVGELAVAWVLRQPQVTSAIAGARRPDQITQIAPAGDWTLSTQNLAEIEALLKQREERLKQA